MSDYELQHYGVLGMKWGVRRGKVDKAYSKASNKLNKLDAKYEKRKTKAVKSNMKADRSPRNAKRQLKAQRASQKMAYSAAKGKRWYESMERTFAKTPVELSAEQKEMGRKYEDVVRNRTVGRY